MHEINNCEKDEDELKKFLGAESQMQKRTQPPPKCPWNRLLGEVLGRFSGSGYYIIRYKI